MGGEREEGRGQIEGLRLGEAGGGNEGERRMGRRMGRRKGIKISIIIAE